MLRARALQAWREELAWCQHIAPAARALSISCALKTGALRHPVLAADFLGRISIIAYSPVAASLARRASLSALASMCDATPFHWNLTTCLAGIGVLSILLRRARNSAYRST